MHAQWTSSADAWQHHHQMVGDMGHLKPGSMPGPYQLCLHMHPPCFNIDCVCLYYSLNSNSIYRAHGRKLLPGQPP
jgi:hypothetical protein